MAAYAPVIAASNQRRDAAQRELAEWRAKRDELAANQKTVEKKITDVAARLGVLADAALAAINARTKAAEARLRKFDAALQRTAPASWNTVQQMAEYDRMSDQRAALQATIAAAARERFDLVRKLVRRDPQGAALAGGWESLETAHAAAANEAAAAQFRRDSVVRAEDGLQKSLESRAADRTADEEVVRIAVPPPPDAAARKAAFAARGSPDAVRALGERFFSQMTLTLPGMEEVDQRAKAGQYGLALDAYKRYFFAKLLAEDRDGGNGQESLDGEASRAATVFPPPTPGQIDLALRGIAVESFDVQGKTRRIEADLGMPGAMPWVFVDARSVADHPHGQELLDFCRRQGYPGVGPARDAEARTS